MLLSTKLEYVRMIAAFAAGMLLAATVVTGAETTPQPENPAPAKRASFKLPPVPEGVTHLDFGNFFKGFTKIFGYCLLSAKKSKLMSKKRMFKQV